jgi:hypothetical protein
MSSVDYKSSELFHFAISLSEVKILSNVRTNSEQAIPSH